MLHGGGDCAERDEYAGEDGSGGGVVAVGGVGCM